MNRLFDWSCQENYDCKFLITCLNINFLYLKGSQHRRIIVKFKESSHRKKSIPGNLQGITFMTHGQNVLSVISVGWTD